MNLHCELKNFVSINPENACLHRELNVIASLHPEIVNHLLAVALKAHLSSADSDVGNYT